VEEAEKQLPEPQKNLMETVLVGNMKNSVIWMKERSMQVFTK
jgi:hypothetical protein